MQISVSIRKKNTHTHKQTNRKKEKLIKNNDENQKKIFHNIKVSCNSKTKKIESKRERKDRRYIK